MDSYHAWCIGTRGRNDCGANKRRRLLRDSGSKAETLDSEGAKETHRVMFIKFYWDVKFADCLLSKREGVETAQQSHCEEWLLIAVCFVTAMGVMIKRGLF